MLPSIKFSRLALAVACLLTALLILVVGAARWQRSQFVSDILQSAVVVWAAICAFQVTRRTSGCLRRLWLLLAVSLFLLSVAQTVETYFQSVAHLPFASPWPSDILFILWVIPALMMLLPPSNDESGGVDWPTILDLVQVGIVALTAYLYFFYVTSRWQAEGQQMVVKVIRLQMYRDLAIAVAFLIRSRFIASGPVRAFFSRVSLFFLLETGSSITYLLSSPTVLGRANWYDVVWCAPYVYMTALAAGWKTPDATSTEEPSASPKATIVSQVLPVSIPLFVLFMAPRIAHEQITLAWAAITASFSVSTARLILTSEKQRRIADNLRRAEIALQQSAEMFTTAFRSSLDAISISSLPEGRYLAVNESFLRMTGYTQEEVLGKSAADLQLWVHEEQRSSILAKLQTGEKVKEEEFLMKTKSGDIRTAQVSAARVHLGGKPGILGMVRDVTERRRAEEALRNSEERFRTLVENLHVGVLLLGPRTEILFANHAAQETFGIPLESILGKTSDDLGWITLREDGTEMPFAMRPGQRVLATGQPVRNEVMGWHRPGSEGVLWILGEVVPLLTREGKLDKLVASFSDITKRKEVEEALHQLSARLLRIQDDERRRLGRELHDSLAQSVMAVNLDLAQVTRSRIPLDKRARRALSEARGVLREMSREIRTLSYLLHPPVLDELGLASAVKEYAHGFSERSGIALEVDVQSDFARIPQETETALFRIVQESLANIQKHSGSPTGKIRLRGDQDRVELEVSDCGCGIAARSQNDGGARKASPLGVGILGMRERMAQLGGTLEVQSNPSGTTIRATIPLVLEGTHATPSHPRG